MKILYTYLKAHKPLLFLALFLAAINQCFSLFDSIIIGKLLNECGVGVADFNGNYGNFTKAVLGWLGLSLGASMISRIAKNFQDYFTNIIIQRTGAQMYTEGIQKALQLPFQDFEDQRSGETLGRLQKVKSDCEKYITLSISMVFQTLIGIIFVVVYAINIHWLLGPIFLATVPVIAIISSFLGKKIKKVSVEILRETTSLAGATTESLRNIELVKSLGLTEQEVERLNGTTIKILGLELKKVRFIRSLSFIQGTTVHFMRTGLVFALYMFIFQGIILPGDLITLMFFSFFLFNPLQELGNVIATYNETKVSMDNFADLMNSKSEEIPSNPKTIGPIDHLRFSNISFKHQSAASYAVQDISFEAQAGETIAFVGPSGSGKTTLVKMLVGLYKPAEGAIYYNEKNANEIDLTELRQQLGFVTQDAQLFSGTIKDNLLFVKPNATDDEINDVLQKSACQNLLVRAENGLNTTIGEGGIKVSGGEKQRLSIARALLRKPRLLLFDEATSALDSITEEEITKTIRSISSQKNQITVLIAHRLSTIMHADKIFVLEQGKIIEQGKHADLLDEKGLYYAMWRQQIGERK
ncbi:ABC transporter ATP-binding protein [Flavobacterium sp. F-380]|uniref:ABC transporter ATP-binding protein n=1 Tax=Flavobacterium kayseriense TaxID=2764714 RepID=A0ABR7J9N1_9FLAO|nr:ABC transporter ATP-binding protein [Flavobacterium kayseriense]MBC5842215.1 ABC transporter ATP-binding protein [Flavobacterium kayseriense]MBC5848745.1 ABC transporter ATP-binding protein [Flavobacterium kayseriense]